MRILDILKRKKLVTQTTRMKYKLDIDKRNKTKWKITRMGKDKAFLVNNPGTTIKGV